MKSGPKPKPLADRFWAKVQKAGPDDCWPWLASRMPKGYGKLGIASTTPKLAHRVSWELHYGPIPEGLFVCHRCDNPPCVNPAHLFLGTCTDNLRDMVAKGRFTLRNQFLVNKLKTECKHGHPFTPENTMWIERRGRPARRCRTCDRQANREYKSRVAKLSTG